MIFMCLYANYHDALCLLFFAYYCLVKLFELKKTSFDVLSSQMRMFGLIKFGFCDFLKVMMEVMVIKKVKFQYSKSMV